MQITTIDQLRHIQDTSTGDISSLTLQVLHRLTFKIHMELFKTAKLSAAHSSPCECCSESHLWPLELHTACCHPRACWGGPKPPMPADSHQGSTGGLLQSHDRQPALRSCHCSDLYHKQVFDDSCYRTHGTGLMRAVI